MARKGSDSETPVDEPPLDSEALGIVRTDIQAALARGQRVVDVDIDNQMKEAYLDYAMSVIVGRALPDARDGLKPVHRRILYAMHERAWRQDRPFVKCAKIVGEVIGNFHPHGDAAVYDTLVRMAQDFSMREILIQGQGNFGSIDGDRPAAYRYTEARLSRIAEDLLADLDRETVDFTPNFDDTRMEPVVLPAGFPNLLVNGSSGIAVGMATNIPPHNLQEVVAATLHLIEHPGASVADLMKFVPAPDFPTGGIIIGGEGLKSAYHTGRGSLRIRARVDVETTKKGRDLLVITEIPYQVNKNTMLEKIGELINNKQIEGIADMRDLSDRHGIRVEIEIKKEASVQVILNQLYSQTQLQVSYGIIMLALVDGQPRLLSLKQILEVYIAHRKEVVVRRTRFELDRAEKRAHILEGLKTALDFIDEVIKIIRGSRTVDEARQSLMARFSLSEVQSNAILEMRLQKLTSLESEKIVEELNELREKIKEYQSILADEKKQYSIVSSELRALSEKQVAARKTVVDHSSVETVAFEVTDLIADEKVVIMISDDGFIKRMPEDTFRRQKRGGRGVRGAASKREDNVRLTKMASTHDQLLLFSNRGKVFALKVHELPVAARDARGKSLKAIINLAADEKITAMASVRPAGETGSLLMVTAAGVIKKLDLDQVGNARKGGIIAIGLSSGDELIDVRLMAPDGEVFLGSQKGLGMRISVAGIRSQGRSAAGVRGIKLLEGDRVAGIDVITPGSSLLVLSARGYGKRVDYEQFATRGRGGKGMAYLKVTEKNGPAVALRSIQPGADVIVVTQNGMTIRMEGKQIPELGRTAVGVRVVNIEGSDQVQDVAVIAEDEE